MSHETLKKSHRCVVKFDKDNKQIVKKFIGDNAEERFNNEIAILTHLEDKGCECVPKILDTDNENLTIKETFVGSPVLSITEADHRVLHNRVEAFGVYHNDSKVNPDLFDPSLFPKIKPVDQVKNEDGTYTVTYEATVTTPRTINNPKNIVQNEEGEYYLIDFEFADLDE